jgi:RNA polymerase sigma-70 factor (ECF subfamily)
MPKVLADDRAQIPDRNLVMECQQGSQAAFRQLYQRHQKRVRSTLYQLCGAAFLDDLTQDVFLKAWKGLPKLRNPDYFGTWLYRICWNVAQDRRRILAQNRDSDEAQLTQAATVSEADLMQLHYQDLVQRGLQSLTLEHRAVLVLHDLEDVPQKEIAKILDIRLGTVKSRLFYARTAMHQAIAAEVGESL